MAWLVPESAAQMNPSRFEARHPQIMRLTAATKPRPGSRQPHRSHPHQLPRSPPARRPIVGPSLVL